MSADATTTLTGTTMGMSLPIASDLASIVQLAGTGSGSSGSGEGIQISGDDTNNRATFQWTPVGTGNLAHTFNFMYTVI